MMNSRRRKSVALKHLREFLGSSSIHGCSYIAGGENLPVKCLWVGKYFEAYFFCFEKSYVGISVFGAGLRHRPDG